MVNDLRILFMALPSKAKQTNEAALYCKVTYKQQIMRFAMGCSIPTKLWEQTKQRAKGKSDIAIRINSLISETEQKIIKAELDLSKSDEVFTVGDIISLIQGKEQHSTKTILQTYQYQLNKMKLLVGKGYAASSIEKYQQFENSVKAFVKYQYKCNDLILSKVNSEFLSKYEVYLKTQRKLKQVTCNKTIQKLKAVMKMAYEYGWIKQQAFPNHKFKHEPTEVIYLTMDDLHKLESYQFTNQRLTRVRDIFLFSVYTGLHYIDAMSLKQDNIITGVDGKEWIKYNRQKTGKWIHIPLLSKAKTLLQQFQLEMSDSVHLIPRISNQKFNSYIKEVGYIAGINTPLTHKVARKTFGSVLLYYNVPMKAVSELMGHSTVLITEKHYAKMELKKLGEVISNIDHQL